MLKYEVIKDIPKGWETEAKIGDVLTVISWKGIPTLVKDNMAVCDYDSHYARHYCRKISG